MAFFSLPIVVQVTPLSIDDSHEYVIVPLPDPGVTEVKGVGFAPIVIFWSAEISPPRIGSFTVITTSLLYTDPQLVVPISRDITLKVVVAVNVDGW